MNDPIKEFVEQNREAFDDLEAPVFNLEGLKARLNPEPVKKNKTLFLFSNSKWLVAASLFLVTGISFLLLNREQKESSSGKLARQKTEVIPQGTEEQNQVIDKNKNHQKIAFASTSNKLVKVKPKQKLIISTATADLYARLSDSTSSSKRLSAILDLDRTGMINNNTIDKLAKTLNSDGNSNVRLAALSVLEKYSYDDYVSSKLISSLNAQSDPMVQLGLVTLLVKMKNININDRLYALANDPNTFDAVKDEAYSALLKEDKL